MDILAFFNQAFDTFFIWPFRLPSNAYAGFALGLAWVALLATIAGELCLALVYFLNRRHYAKLHRDMVKHNNLSIRAIACKDKESYKACNDIANEEFGKNFFANIALFASSVWPAFLVLGWLDGRFRGILFNVPLVGEVGSAFFFVPTYIVIRVCFCFAKPWIPGFRTIKRKIAENEAGERMLSFTDLGPKDKENEATA